MPSCLILMEALVCALFLADAAGGAPSVSWSPKTPYEALCTPTGFGICNLGFSIKTFPYQETEDGVDATPPAIYNITIHDRDCKILTSAASTKVVKISEWFTSDTEPPRFDISTPVNEVKLTGYQHTAVFWCDTGWNDGGCLAPVFEHLGKKAGGKHGCACGNIGLEKGLKWACKCPFDC